jgi:hypothetical protein
MTIWTRMALFTAIALLPVMMDDIHDYFVDRKPISVQVANVNILGSEMQQFATTQVR